MKFTMFYRPTHERGHFSQWYPHDMVWDGVVGGMTFHRCEQWMMFQKAMLFRDFYHAGEIMKSATPSQDKALGRKVGGFNQQVWDASAEEIIKRGNRLKFSGSLESALLDTRGTVLVEASPTDRIYGIGMNEYNPGSHDYEKWAGRNQLGFALTDIRIERQPESAEFMRDYEAIKQFIKEKFSLSGKSATNQPVRTPHPFRRPVMVKR